MDINHMKNTIVKLEERGVIGKAHAEAMLLLIRKLETPSGKLVSKVLRYVVVKAIAELLMRSFDDR